MTRLLIAMAGCCAIAAEAASLEITRLTWAGVQIASDRATVFVDAIGRDIWNGNAPQGYVAPSPETERRYALVTHPHNDHFDVESLKTLLGERGYVIAAEADATYIASRGLRVIPARHYEPISRSGFTFVAVPAVDGIGDEQVSWVIRHGDQRFFHAGDTMLHGKLATIGDNYGPFDVAFLPVNGARIQIRDGLSVPAVMDPEQAVTAAQTLRAVRSVPIHYGLNDPPYYVEVPDSANAFVRLARDAGLAASRLKPGEQIELSTRPN